MYRLYPKKELTRRRLLLKTSCSVNSFFVSNITYNLILLKYALIKYFFKIQVIQLNRKILGTLLKEELGTTFILKL